MKILTVDFESYYSQEFSLSKITNEEYVRSPEFEVIGVSVQINDGKPKWFTGDMIETAVFLRQFDWENSLALAHHAPFDASILTWVFGIKPKGWLDTLSMARALHGTEVGGSLAALAQHYGVGTKGTEVVMAKGLRRKDFPEGQLAEYGRYCCNDTAMTYALFQKMSVGFPPSELRLIDLTIRMFSDPVLQLDEGVLIVHLGEVRRKKQELLSKMLIEKDQLMSNPQLAKVLEDLGVVVPMKISPANGKMTYAFSKADEEFKALLEHDNVIVQAIVAARLGVKSTIEETRTERFSGIAKRGPMPVPLRYYAAHTGRWGGDDKLNLQNLPRKSPLKYSIIAPDGYVVLDSDSSQIEARTLAWLAGQDDLVEAFDRGEDVYCIMASAIYGRLITKADKTARQVGKVTVLGCGYGMGAAKFQIALKNAGVEVPLEEAKRIIDTYRATYPNIVRLWAAAGDMLKAMLRNAQTAFGRGNLLEVDGANGIRLPNGLYLKYPNLRLREDEKTGKVEVVYDTKKGKAVIPNRIYGPKLVENCCQALARIVIGEQMLMVAKKYKVAMTVHDSIGAVVPKSEAETAKEYVELCMRLRPSWAPELPLNCEAGYGDSYGDC
jgi:DNA polymerase